MLVLHLISKRRTSIELRDPSAKGTILSLLRTCWTISPIKCTWVYSALSVCMFAEVFNIDASCDVLIKKPKIMCAFISFISTFASARCTQNKFLSLQKIMKHFYIIYYQSLRNILTTEKCSNSKGITLTTNDGWPFPLAAYIYYGLAAHRMRSNCNNYYGRKKTSKNNLGANLFSISKIIAVFADWRVKGKWALRRTA